MAFDQQLGISFLPSGGAIDPSGPSGTRLEDVLRILSFRLPRILGARPIAPRGLLEQGFSGGSAGDPLANAITQGVLSSVLRRTPSGTSTVSSVGAAPDLGAPSPLGRILGPVLGPQSPATRTLPVETPQPGFVVQEPPAAPGPAAPSPGPVDLNRDFNDVQAQLLGRRRRA